MSRGAGHSGRERRLADWKASLRVLTAGALVLGVGCSDLSYARDDAACDGDPCAPDAEAPRGLGEGPLEAGVQPNEAGTAAVAPRDSSVDAGATPPGQAPEAEAGLPDAAGPPKQTPPGSQPPAKTDGFRLGYYAIRARFFAQGTQSVGGLAQEIIMLGHVTRDAQSGALSLDVQSCYDHATSAAGSLSIKAHLFAPEKYPSRSYAITVTGDTFETNGPPALAGYTAEPPMTCPAGSRVPSPAGQPWRTGDTCSCPRNAEPPTSADDCRVVDSDGDGKPGFTVRWTGLVTRDVYAARRDSSRFVAGKIDPNGRHFATYRWSHEHLALACTSGSCSTDGPQFRPCEASVGNPVSFALLGEATTTGGAFTCADVVANMGALFAPDPLGIPADC